MGTLWWVGPQEASPLSHVRKGFFFFFFHSQNQMSQFSDSIAIGQSHTAQRPLSEIKKQSRAITNPKKGNKRKIKIKLKYTIHNVKLQIH